MTHPVVGTRTTQLVEELTGKYHRAGLSARVGKWR